MQLNIFRKKSPITYFNLNFYRTNAFISACKFADKQGEIKALDH